jgi:hypothetical protein
MSIYGDPLLKSLTVVAQRVAGYSLYEARVVEGEKVGPTL